MDVHHHAHSNHGKKTLKNYFWEFLMLFLAVFCGSLAEYELEHFVDHQKEREYIKSMIEDAKTDTANIQEAIALNTNRAQQLDTLSFLCQNYDISGKDDENIHRLFRYSKKHPDFITPTERTILQLKNAGGMRLIRNKKAVDKIILYDDMTKKLADQQAYYELYQNKSIQIGAQIMNFQNLGMRKSGLQINTEKPKKLINRDNLKLIEFGNTVQQYQGVVSFYVVRLKEMNERAIQLIETLQKEYHLENE
jgi:hypothetical protein